MIKITKPEIINKGWGREIVIANNDEYCGKILEFKAGSKFSDHFHKEKHETFYVLDGILNLYYYDLTNGTKLYKLIQPGDVIVINRGEPHQIEAITDSKIMEVSTHHEDSDSYRIGKGDSQK